MDTETKVMGVDNKWGGKIFILHKDSFHYTYYIIFLLV